MFKLTQIFTNKKIILYDIEKEPKYRKVFKDTKYYLSTEKGFFAKSVLNMVE